MSSDSENEAGGAEQEHEVEAAADVESTEEAEDHRAGVLRTDVKLGGARALPERAILYPT